MIKFDISYCGLFDEEVNHFVGVLENNTMLIAFRSIYYTYRLKLSFNLINVLSKNTNILDFKIFDCIREDEYEKINQDKEISSLVKRNIKIFNERC